jgi:hypothetical protein
LPSSFRHYSVVTLVAVTIVVVQEAAVVALVVVSAVVALAAPWRDAESTHLV